jgi:hypothetical protein
MDQTFIGINLLSLAYSLKPAQDILCIYSNLVYNKSQLHTLCSYDLVLPLIINPNENMTRTLRMIEMKQNGLCVSCRGKITCDHAVVSSGKPRHYYHKYCALKHHII